LLTFNVPPIPTPPLTTNAPVLGPVEIVFVLIVIGFVVIAPRPVTDCKVEISDIITIPELVLTTISVPV
jgi:hypothetical protein